MRRDDLAGRSNSELVGTALGLNGEEHEYWHAVAELQRRRTPDVMAVATSLTASPDARSRQLGLDIMGQLGYEEGRPFLEQVLPVALVLANDPDPSVRHSAISTLGHQWDVRALPAVLEQVKDPDPDVRWAAATAIPSLVSSPPEPAAVEALIALT